nr:hypothetical protein [Tanacetum cinerariifolium]
MKENPQLQPDDLPIWLTLKYKFERLHVSNTPCRPFVVRPRDQDDPHDDAHLEGENSAKRQKTSEHETYVFRESSSGQVNESDPGPSTSGNQKQLEDFDFWMDSYATDDDELPTEKVSQELKGNSGPEKIVMSLYKYPAVIFPVDDIEERTSRWVDKCVNKFNPYARYNIEHWKNP